MDVFWHLAEDDTAIRQKAVVDLIDGIKSQQATDLKDAAQNNTDVKKTEDGLDLPLDYALNRLVKGLASGRQSARQGFSAALSQVLAVFPAIPTSVVVKIANSRAAAATAYSGQEKRDFQLGVVFLLLVLVRADRLRETPEKFVASNVAVVFDLLAVSPQMGEICAEALLMMSKQLSSEILLTHIVPKIVTSLPNTVSALKPQELSLCTLIFELSVKGLLVGVDIPKYIATLFTSNLHGPLFGVLEKSFAAYPPAHSVFGHLVNTMAHLSSTNVYSANACDVTPQNSMLLVFWKDVIVNFIAKAFSYHLKGLALDVLCIAVKTVYSLAKVGDNTDSTWFNQWMSCLFTPEYTQLFMTHLKDKQAVCYGQALAVHDTLLAIGSKEQGIAIGIINTLSNPNNGGHRLFDIKTHKALLKQLQKTLDHEGSATHMTNVVAAFDHASESAKQSIQNVLIDSKNVIVSLEKEIEELKNMKDLKNSAEVISGKESELAELKSNGMKENMSIDEYIATAQGAALLADAANAIQLWAVDQISEMAKNARNLSISLEKKQGTAKTSNDNYEARIKTCVNFLFRNAFFKQPQTESSKKVKKSDSNAAFIKENPVDATLHVKVRRGCIIAITSLLADLLGQQQAAIESSKVNGSSSAADVNKLGAYWAEEVLEYWSQLEQAKFTLNIEGWNEGADMALQAIRGMIGQLQSTIGANVTETTPAARKIVSQARAFYLFTVHVSILLLTDCTDYAPAIMDLEQVCQRAFGKKDSKKKSKKTTTDDEPVYIEVLIDVLLSLLVKPSTLIRTLVQRVFTTFAGELNMEAIHDLIKVLVDAEHNEDEDMENDDDDDDIEEDEEDVENDDEDDMNDDDKSAILAKNSKKWDPLDGDVNDVQDVKKMLQLQQQHDDAVDKELEGYDFTGGMLDNVDDESVDIEGLTHILSLPAFTSTHDGFQSEHDRALQQLVQMKKMRNVEHKNIKRDAAHFKLRIVDLIEVLLSKFANTTLSLYFYDALMTVLKSSIGSEMKPLFDRVYNLYLKQLSKPYVYKAIDEKSLVVPEYQGEEALLNAPAPEYIMEILVKKFADLKSNTNAQMFILEAAAIGRLTNQYLCSNASKTEMEALEKNVLVPSDKKKKKAAVADVTDKTALLKKLSDMRMTTVAELFNKMYITYLFSKRSAYPGKFFADLFLACPALFINKVVLPTVLKSITNSPSTYLRSESLNTLTSVFNKYKQYLNKEELIVMVQDTLRNAHAKGIEGLSMVDDTVKQEADKIIKQEVVTVNVGKKKAKDTIKLGGDKAQKAYMKLLTKVYRQYAALSGADVKGITATVKKEKKEKTKKEGQVKAEGQTKEEKKEEPVIMQPTEKKKRKDKEQEVITIEDEEEEKKEKKKAKKAVTKAKK